MKELIKALREEAQSWCDIPGTPGEMIGTALNGVADRLEKTLKAER